MPFVIDDKHVKVCGCTVVWDAITKPEQSDFGGDPRYALKVLVPPHCPDLPLIEQLAQQTLAESAFKGVLPNGARWASSVAGPAEFNGMFPGWTVINPGTRLGAPPVYDEAGATMDPMQYGPLIYQGQQVDVMIHTYAYDNKSKGVATGLDAFGINASLNAPRLQLSGSAVDTAAAFGGAAAPVAQPAAAPAPAAPPQQAHGMLPGAPAAAPAPAPGAAAPAPAPAPAAEPTYMHAGQPYTHAQLIAGGWAEAQIAALPQA